LRRSWRALVATTATAISLGLASVATTTANAAARPLGTSYSAAGALYGVAAAANDNAWAVGYAGKNPSPRVLMLHWNGSAWSRVTGPSVLTGAGQLTAITVVNSKDAWAAGFTGNPLKTIHTLLLHWNGRAWSQITSPAPVKDGELSAVTATAKGGFAAGFYYTGEAATDYWTLSFRLAGSKWSRVAAKTNNAAFDGVATTTAGTTWATANAVGMITGGLARWTGGKWKWTSFPVQGQYHALNGIAAGPRGIALAVGTNNNFPSTPALAMKWTGSRWEKVTVSAPKASGLNAVTFAPGGSAWAAGAVSGHTLIVRWNGRKWNRVTSPALGPDTSLYGIGFSAAGYGWSVGDTFTSSGAARTVILHWNGHRWS
jgi:hypothetical protein